MKRKLIKGKSYVAMAILVACSVLVGCEKENSDALTDETVGVETTPDGSPVSHQKVTGGTCPSFTCPTGYYNNGQKFTISCGCYIQSGLGVNKQAYKNAGANDNFIASAMGETNTMDARSYAYGDYKTGDAGNFGVCKQNWGMLRQSSRYFKGQSASQWNNGAALNSDKVKDINSYYDGWNKWGEWAFLAGHRNGSTGLNEALAGRYSYDIKNFIYAFEWTRSQIQRSSNYRINDVRFWCNIPAI